MPTSALSQVPGSPSFRDAAVNAVALVPLLSTTADGDLSSTSSASAFGDLWTALRRHSNAHSIGSELLMVVPNNNLTRPGDWNYNDTPLTTFHWQHGCQRLRLFDGRPSKSRLAHDRLYNDSITRDWIDACPNRRTAAVIGILNMHDCKDLADLHRAEQELQAWATRYATPPYEVTAHSKKYERDSPVTRLFVFDSFDEVCQRIDLSQSNMGANILAFPASDDAHKEMMDFHLNLVLNDLTVAIFRALEKQIQESDEMLNTALPSTSSARSSRRTFSQLISGGADGSETPVATAKNLTLSSMSTLVNLQSKTPKESSEHTAGESERSETDEKAEESISPRESDEFEKRDGSSKIDQSMHQLLTPMDEVWDFSELSPKDAHAVRQREAGRREKYAADLALLAGSPLDAYSRYLKAAHALKDVVPDPFWYALALEGCAAAHISMAEGGGYDVDEYLDNNFKMPDDIIALAQKETRDEVRSPKLKQTLPEVVFRLCEEALNITQRHARSAPFYASLLLKMALYSSEYAEGHLRCRWGEGEGCYSGRNETDPTEPARWQKTSMAKLKFGDLKNAENQDMMYINVLNRTKKFCELLHKAVSAGALDPATRVDVAARSTRLCLHGVKASQWKKENGTRIELPRKAAFFAAAAADALSCTGNAIGAEELWILACRLYTRRPNKKDGSGSYGWATLRSSTLFALSLERCSPASKSAADELLALVGELSPPYPEKKLKKRNQLRRSVRPPDTAIISDDSIRSESSVRTLGQDSEGGVKTSAFAKKMFHESFTSMTTDSSLLAIQAKWADEQPVAPVYFPLPGSKAIVPLPCVWTAVSYIRCADVQQMCLDRIVGLHRGLPTPSTSKSMPVSKAATLKELPLFVSSDFILRDEPGLELERVTVRTKVAKEDEGAMATFFNPYAKKKLKVATTRVAGDEERALSIKFGNRLSVPLLIQRCDLVFGGNADGRIQAAALSFTVPPRSKNFTVDFPFTIRAPYAREETAHEIFEVKGFSLNCMGRSVFLNMHEGTATDDTPMAEVIPRSAAFYSKDLPAKVEEEKKDEVDFPKLEAYPCQPRLQVLFDASNSPIQTDSCVDINISPGEVYTVPSLRLENYAGPNNEGTVQQLQILAIDFPGKSEQLLYCSNEGGNELSFSSDSEFGNKVLKLEGENAIRIRAVNPNISLENVNAKGSKLTLQIASSLTVTQKLLESITAKIRFRFRGQATSDAEVWRVFDIPMNITAVNGPFISSIAFKPGLMKRSGFAQLSKCLLDRAPLVASSHDEDLTETDADSVPDTESSDISALECVGKAPGLHVCTENVIFVLTVTNPFDCDLKITHGDGAVGGFGDHHLDDVVVRALLSTSFPVTLDRISRDSNVISDLIEKLSLQWSSLDKDGAATGTGFLQIPRESVKQVIRRHPSFLSKVCQPPCQLKLSKSDTEVDDQTLPLEFAMGELIDFGLEMDLAPWIPEDCLQEDIVLEFFCARTDNHTVSRRDHVWTGRVRQLCPWSQSKATDHRVGIVWVAPGDYVVSGCARLGKEVWWAPVAARVRIRE